MTTVNINLREISGLVGLTENLSRARVDFSPYRAYADDDGWVTRNILRVKAPEGIAAPALPPTPLGNAYEVQERGFREGRHGYVLVPDVAEVDYVDLVWVDKDTLDPEASPDPAWVAEVASLVVDIEAAQDAADSAIAGLATKVNTSTYTAGLAAKADATALTAEATARSDADALLQPAATLDADVADLVPGATAIAGALNANFVRFVDDATGDPITGWVTTIRVNTTTGEIADIVSEEI